MEEEMICRKAKSSEWKSERVREDASGDSEDGEEDDELMCDRWKETVSDETRKDQWGVCSIDKVQHTEKSD